MGLFFRTEEVIAKQFSKLEHLMYHLSVCVYVGDGCQIYKVSLLFR